MGLCKHFEHFEEKATVICQNLWRSRLCKGFRLALTNACKNSKVMKNLIFFSAAPQSGNLRRKLAENKPQNASSLFLFKQLKPDNVPFFYKTFVSTKCWIRTFLQENLWSVFLLQWFMAISAANVVSFSGIFKLTRKKWIFLAGKWTNFLSCWISF